MTEHLSALQLDELAAGLTTPPEHLASCPQCLKQLAQLRAESAAFLARPEAQQQLGRLLPPPQRRPLGRLLAIALPLAAVLALLLTWPKAPVEDRIKGAPTVMLLDGTGNPVTHAAPGTKLTLVVGSAGFPRVTVFTLAEDGTREPLYAGPVAAGARVPLMKLEVTPGDVTVVAVFERDAESQSVSVRLAVP